MKCFNPALLVILLFCSCTTHRHTTVPALAPVQFNDPVIRELEKHFQIMMFAHAENVGSHSYLVAGFHSGKWYRVSCSMQAFMTNQLPAFKYEPIRKGLGDSVLHVFIESGFSAIKPEDTGCDWDMLPEEKKKITCGVHDAQPLALTLYIKGRGVTKIYTGPGYWLCCEGKEDRLKFIECKNALFAAGK